MKKVLKSIVNILAWVVLILALLVTILVFSSARNNGVANLYARLVDGVDVLDGSSGANLRAAGALRTAVAPLV